MSKFTRNTILYSIIFFLSSCSTWHYTNYGKPFDFLKAERVAFNNGHISKKNKKELTADFNVKEQVNIKNSTIKSEISSPNNQLIIQNYSPSSKKEPQFILLDTYRMIEHCGPNDDDYLNYRQPKEIIFWKNNCPIKKMEKFLLSKKILNNKEIKNLKLSYQNKINTIFEKCKKKKFVGTKLKKIKLYA